VLFLQVSQTLQLFDSLLHLHQDVSTSTSSLTGACEELMAEKASLVEFAGMGGWREGIFVGRVSLDVVIVPCRLAEQLMFFTACIVCMCRQFNICKPPKWHVHSSACLGMPQTCQLLS
jgi:hypothetical protein